METKDSDAARSQTSACQAWYRKDQQNDHPKVHYSIDKCWIDNYAWYIAKMEEIVSVIVTAVDTASLSTFYALFDNDVCITLTSIW